MAKVRVLVVEDSVTVRRVLVDVLRSDPTLEVVGEAEDGRRAIELCRELRPDVMTLDMMLPVMTGLAATEYIMAHFPTPILIVSASVNRGEVFHTYDALAAGAVDVLDKPGGDHVDGVWEERFKAAVKMVARIKVITHPRGRRGALGQAPPRARSGGRCEVVAIGASTGGPAAVVELLRALPAPFPAPIVLVIHLGDPFGTLFGDWLDGQSAHRVTVARGGEPLAVGRVLMAPPGRHLVVRGGVAHLSNEAERHSCRPSVDVLFESIAADMGQRACAALLTGMGRDGAAGLLAIRQRGGLTIAQDEASSVVWGMPREAVRIGAAERVLPLAEIGPALTAYAQAGEARP